MSATSARIDAPELDVAEPATSGVENNRAEGARVERPEPATFDAAPAAEQVIDIAAERMNGARRVREASALPPALRERLAAVVEASGEVAADGQTRLSLDECLAAIESALPDFLTKTGASPARAGHPGGEAFFRGNGEISDQEAEEIARGQLARSGLLRGQRVRVAD
jgi:hypothetical protein